MMFVTARPRSTRATVKLRNALPKQLQISGSMSASELVVSIIQVAPSSQMPLTPCISGIRSHTSAMRTYRTSGPQEILWNTGAMTRSSGK